MKASLGLRLAEEMLTAVSKRPLESDATFWEAVLHWRFGQLLLLTSTPLMTAYKERPKSMHGSYSAPAGRIPAAICN